MTNDGRIERAAAVLRAAWVEGDYDLDVKGLLHAVATQVDDVEVTRHPLGFIHADLSPLAKVAAHERLRLHVWTDDSPSCTDGLGPVHDHVWEGKSAVLAGSLTNSLLRVVKATDGPYTMSEASYVDDVQYLTIVDKGLDLQEIEQKQVDQGSWYFLPRRLIHSTRINLYPTATLVLANYVDTGRPRVVSNRNPEPGPRIRSNVPADATLSALDKVLAAIG